MKNQKSTRFAFIFFVGSILTLNFQVSYSQSGDLDAWKTDFAHFKKAFEEGTPVSAKLTEEELVSWTATFRSAETKPIPNGGVRYDVILDLPSIETKDGKLVLEFICEEADFGEWKQVPKGSKVEFNALWLKMMMAFPNQPISTLFSNTKLRRIVEKSAGEN